MKRKIKPIHYVLIILLTMSTVVQSAEEGPNHDWAVIVAVQQGEKLFLKLKDGRKIKGKLNTVSETMISLSDGNQTTQWGRQDILEIRLGYGRSMKKSILIGALIGTGAGAVLGGAAAASDNGEWFDVKASQGIPIGAAVGAIVGSAVGAVVGLFGRQGDLIYQAYP